MKEVLQSNFVNVKAPLINEKQMEKVVNTRQLCIGLCALISGALFYYFFRSPEHTYFLKFIGNGFTRNDVLPPLPTTIFDCLPTIIHVFAFSILTASFITPQKRGYFIVCFSWFVIDILFELGQGFADNIIPSIPGWFSNIIFLENTRSYFLHGRLDYFDLLSIGLGSLVAYIVLMKTAVGEVMS